VQHEFSAPLFNSISRRNIWRGVRRAAKRTSPTMALSIIDSYYNSQYPTLVTAQPRGGSFSGVPHPLIPCQVLLSARSTSVWRNPLNPCCSAAHPTLVPRGHRPWIPRARVHSYKFLAMVSRC